jgi:DinB superfamily
MQNASAPAENKSSEETRLGRPQPTDAAPFYFTYIDLVQSHDILAALDTQLTVTLDALSAISEQTSLFRYAPDKWTIRQVLTHITDAERVFTFRAFWFARGLSGELPKLDPNLAVESARADTIPWSQHVDAFRHVRLATLSLFGNLPLDAWDRSGIASGSSITVHALAFVTAGHVAHHLRLLHERYLPAINTTA